MLSIYKKNCPCFSGMPDLERSGKNIPVYLLHIASSFLPNLRVTKHTNPIPPSTHAAPVRTGVVKIRVLLSMKKNRSTNPVQRLKIDTYSGFAVTVAGLN